MADLEALDKYLSSEASPENSMLLSDLDGFLTGIVCSPELIMPSEWLPVVWGGTEPDVSDIDTHIWAMQAVLERYNEIASELNGEPPAIEPLFWEAPEGHAIAMDWCEGFMQALALRRELWAELLETEQGRDWMFPVFAHLFDEDGKSLVGAQEKVMDALLDTASRRIPETVPNVFTYWKSKRSQSN
ncbi:YecA/YgfB family protein [Mesorhizobium sp. 10J20-29]